MTNEGENADVVRLGGKSRNVTRISWRCRNNMVRVAILRVPSPTLRLCRGCLSFPSLRLTVRQKVVLLRQPHPNPPQSWGGNSTSSPRSDQPENERSNAPERPGTWVTPLFSPKTGGDTEGVEPVGLCTPLTFCRLVNPGGKAILVHFACFDTASPLGGVPRVTTLPRRNQESYYVLLISKPFL